MGYSSLFGSRASLDEDRPCLLTQLVPRNPHVQSPLASLRPVSAGSNSHSYISEPLAHVPASGFCNELLVGHGKLLDLLSDTVVGSRWWRP